MDFPTGVNSAPVIAPETPNQLATDRATLAQEEEDAIQQQDNDDIGWHVIHKLVLSECQNYLNSSIGLRQSRHFL